MTTKKTSDTTIPNPLLNLLRALAKELIGLVEGAAHAVADNYIRIKVKDSNGERKAWPESCSWLSEAEEGNGLSLLLIAPSGAGKTTLLKEIALHLARGDNSRLAFYLHLGWLQGKHKTPLDYLINKYLEDNPDAAKALTKIENEGRLIRCLSRYLSLFYATSSLISASSCGASSRAGLSQTTFFLLQSRVLPDQRSGRCALACS